MGKLVLKLPDGRTRDIPLDRERLTIGRRADNDVCLPYPAVSGEHAAVVTILDDSFLEDLNSTNGTLVNGKSVAKHFLRDHDEIDIGRQMLVYVSGGGDSIPAGAASAGEPKAKAKRGAAETPVHAKSRPQSGEVASAGPSVTAMPSPGPHAEVPVSAREPDSSSRSGRRVDTTPLVREPPMVTTPAGTAEETRSAGSTPTPALEVVEGSGAGRVVSIDRDVFVVGRVGLQLAAVNRTPDGLRLVHVEGDTPPRINGAALPEEGSLLALGDEIEIAGARLRFHPAR
jgi:predicted component of type VI protein secretion system